MELLCCISRQLSWCLNAEIRLRPSNPALQVVGFVPTGWTYEMKRKTYPVRSKEACHIHLVPYSEHSSYTELRDYVRFLKPQHVGTLSRLVAPQALCTGDACLAIAH